MTTVQPTVTLDARPFITRGQHVFAPSEYEDDFRTFKPPSEYMWTNSRRVIRFNAERVCLNVARGHLLVRRLTSSGRESVFPIGNDATARAAYHVIESLKNANVIDIDTLLSRTPYPPQQLLQLLSLFYMHGIVTP